MTASGAMRGRFVALAAAVAVAAVVGAATPPRAVEDDPALERTREQVKMLDALYKNAVVAITDVYQRGAPAIHVGQRVFAEMKKAGYHDVRLVDATDAPMDEENVAASDFEKRALAKIKAGEPYYEEIAGEGANRHLLAATVVPAVHPRCAACHGVKEGDLLGFLRYDLLIK